MGSIFDYLNWRGDLSLQQAPFNPVDNVILTHLSYLPLDGIVSDEIGALSIADTAKVFAARLSEESTNDDSQKYNFIYKEDPALLEAVGKSHRYGAMKLAGFVNQIDPVEEKQFAALTILTGDDHAFIIFRGTDDSLVGWKEDFNMAFYDEIPAQAEALQYLETMARHFKMPLRIGGHSKGGNLGIYAASFCSKKTQKRIVEIYVNDAPGFSGKVINSEGYQAVKNKIRAYIPEGSVVGLLFEHDINPSVIKSRKIGLLQHDVYSWEIMGNDLVYAEGISKGSSFIAVTVKEWMANLDINQRRDFIEALFTILNSTEADTFPQIGTDWLKNSIAMLYSFTSLDDNSQNILAKTLRMFFRAARKNIPALLPTPLPHSQFPQKKIVSVND